MSGSGVLLTEHAIRRCRERVGISLKRTARLAARALTHGTPPEDAKPSLRRFLERRLAASVEQHHGRKVFIRAFKGFCFIFGDRGVLLTVFPLRRSGP